MALAGILLNSQVWLLWHLLSTITISTEWTFLSFYPADTSVHPSATTFLIVHTHINIQQHTSFVVLIVTDGSHQSAKHICRLVVNRKRHDWYKAEISALETGLRSSAELQAQIRSGTSSRGSICQIKRPRLFQVKPAMFEVETSPQLQTSAVQL